MGALVALRGWPKMSIAALWRALFNTGPGPDAGGENPGPSELDQMREKSRMDAALCVALLAARTGRLDVSSAKRSGEFSERCGCASASGAMAASPSRAQ